MKNNDILNEGDNKKVSKFTPINYKKSEKLLQNSKWYKKNKDKFLFRSVNYSYDIEDEYGTMAAPLIEERTMKKRPPTDTPAFINDTVNDEFKKQFGLKASPREVGFFALNTNNPQELRKYSSNIYKCVPLDENYKLYVIPTAYDFFEHLEEKVTNYLKEFVPIKSVVFFYELKEIKTWKQFRELLVNDVQKNYTEKDVDLIIEEVKQIIAGVVSQYQEVDRIDAMRDSMQEVVIVSNSLLLMPEDFD